jgi:hypothetical protein
MSAASKESATVTAPTDKWMTVQQVAVALETSRHLVLKRAAAGEFQTEVVAGRLVFSRASVERARLAAVPA